MRLQVRRQQERGFDEELLPLIDSTNSTKDLHLPECMLLPAIEHEIAIFKTSNHQRAPTLEIRLPTTHHWVPTTLLTCAH